MFISPAVHVWLAQQSDKLSLRHTHTLPRHISITKWLFLTCCNSSWWCRSCARSSVSWQLSGSVSWLPRSRPWWLARLGIRAGARCQHTPGCQHCEPEPEPSAPERPGIERHSHTEEKVNRKNDNRLCNYPTFSILRKSCFMWHKFQLCPDRAVLNFPNKVWLSEL